MLSRGVSRSKPVFASSLLNRCFSNISHFDNLDKAIAAIDHEQPFISAILVGEDWHP